MNEEEFYRKYKKVGEVDVIEDIDKLENDTFDWIVLNDQLYSRSWED